MPTLSHQLQSKVDTLEVGVITHLHNLSVTNTGEELSARSIWNDPRIYKPIFSLKELGIERTLKSVVLEVRDSIARIYYILDSSCFFIDFVCDYQILELVKELPTEVIHYLRILCSKKGRLELIVREDNLYLLFEDTFPSKMPAKERKEKEVDKYVLSVPLREVVGLDKAVTEFVKEVVALEDTNPISYEDFNIPIDFSSIAINKEPIEYWMSVVSTPKGDFKIIDTSGINSTLVICPVEVSMRQSSTLTNNLEVSTLEELTPESEDMSEYIELLNDIMEEVSE
jgi:hypothetical protein